MKRILGVLVCSAVFALTSPAAAEIVLYETDFERPHFVIGNLVGQDGWANHSGSGSFIQVVSGQAVELNHGGGSREDANIGLGHTLAAGQTFTFEFDVIVNSNPVLAVDAATTYFAHLKDGGTGFNARTFVTAPNTTGSNAFTFGIGETSSSTPAATFATDFTYGVLYHLTGTYDFNTGISELNVMGVGSIFSTSQADPGENLSAFAFRQSGGNTNQTIDNLKVSLIPEPSSFTLLGVLAGFGFIRRRN